jgi:hypothetical protein
MMATRFVVTQIKPCPRCKGCQFVQEPIWKDYWVFVEEFRSKNERVPNPDEDRDWWAERGYFDWEPANSGGIPPEECECRECGGTGRSELEVDLHAALKAYEEMGACGADIDDTSECTCGWH